MTHNPTQAEVQAAYDETKYIISVANVVVLRAVVARYTLRRWKVDDLALSSTADGMPVKATGFYGRKRQYFIKDAAP